MLKTRIVMFAFLGVLAGCASVHTNQPQASGLDAGVEINGRGQFVDASGSQLSLAEARTKIAAIFENPSEMGAVTARLSAKDQLTFLTEVNKALSDLPGKREEMTSKFMIADREALLASKRGNLRQMMATVFATVPLESLTVLCGLYNEELFDRSGSGPRAFSKDQVDEITEVTLKDISAKCEGLPDAAPRYTLAVFALEKPPPVESCLLDDTVLDRHWSHSAGRPFYGH